MPKTTDKAPDTATTTAPASAPRQGRQTKAMRVREMLQAETGASLDAICQATGWQPHSVRAVISGLRKAGCTVERTRSGADGGTVYRLTAAPKEAQA